MPQLNMHVTPEFEADLQEFMKRRGLKAKSEAIRVAVKEALKDKEKVVFKDYKSLLGLGNKGEPNPNPRFKSDDDLWEKG